MDDLMSLYSNTPASLHEMDFNEKNETMAFTTTICDPKDNTVELKHTQAQSFEMVTDLLNSCSVKDRKATCLVTVPLETTRNPYRLDIKSENYDHLLDSFGLLHYASYALTTSMTFDVIPRYQNETLNGFFASVFVEHFFGLFLVYDEKEDLTLGVCWAGTKILPRFLDAISRLKSLSLQPGFVLLATAITFNSYHNYRLTFTAHFIAQVEKRTGHQGWNMVAHKSAQGSFSDISAKMSGFATSLAANRRLTRMCDEILLALDSKISLSEGGIPRDTSNQRDRFNSHVAVVKRRIAVQHVYIDVLLARVQAQITALLNSINRSETELGIEVAKDSRMISLASKRDSTSMKTLAAVTIAFLPGTFVASLFSMSMFNWQATIGSFVTPRFWIYWAVTVPLTLATVGVWYVWINKRAAFINSQNGKALKELDDIAI